MSPRGVRVPRRARGARASSATSWTRRGARALLPVRDLPGTLERHRARHEAAGNGFGYVVRGLDEVAGAIVCGGMGRERNLIVDAREHSMTPTTNVKGAINDRDIRKMTAARMGAPAGLPRRLPAASCRHAPVQAAGKLRDRARDQGHRRAGARGARARSRIARVAPCGRARPIVRVFAWRVRLVRGWCLIRVGFARGFTQRDLAACGLASRLAEIPVHVCGRGRE